MTRNRCSHRGLWLTTAVVGLWSLAPIAAPITVDNVRSLEGTQRWSTQGIPVFAAEVSEDGSRIFGTRGHMVTVWDASDGTIRASWPADPGYAAGLALSPDESLLATAGSIGAVKIWEAATGRLIHTLSPGGTHTVDFSPDGTRVASGGSPGVLHVWDVDSGDVVHEIATGSGTFEVRFSPDGATIATVHGRPDFAVRLWNAETGEMVWESLVHSGDVHALAFSPDGSHLATVDGDGHVYLLDAVTGDRLHSFVGHQAPLFHVRFITANLLASADGSGRVRFWNVDERRWLSAVHLFREQVSALAADPNAEFLVLASFDMEMVIVAIPED